MLAAVFTNIVMHCNRVSEGKYAHTGELSTAGHAYSVGHKPD